MNVLILTDFSEVSENAAKYALDYLKDTPSTISLLNIQDINLNQQPAGKLEQQMLSISKKLHAGIEELIKYSTNPAHKFHTTLSLDNLITAVRRCVEEKKIDLIFIGASSQEERKHPILGNHAYEVIRKIKSNIIAVPGTTKFVEPRRMILPIDYSVLSSNTRFTILSKPEYMRAEKLTIMNVSDEKEVADSHKEVKEGIAQNFTRELKFANLDQGTFNKDLLFEIQDRYDLIAIMGKNLTICDKLLHTRYGLCSTVSNKLPILVLHGLNS